MMSIVEDFADIKARLAQIEQEKKETPKPETVEAETVMWPAFHPDDYIC